MSARFQLSALPLQRFRPLFTLSSNALAEQGMARVAADVSPGYPCRVSLQDAEVGEELILLPFVHHDADTPYRSSGPIFVRVNAEQAMPAVSEVPDSVRRRLLSVRAYGAQGFLRGADVVEGLRLEEAIEKLFEDEQTAYLHLHNARPGCYNCRVDRVD